MREGLADRPQTPRAYGAPDARALRRELAAAMTAVLAFESFAYLDSRCAPPCVARNLI